MDQSIESQILTKVEREATFQEGYRLLLSHFQERIYWHVRKFVLYHDDANDVVQNTFVKVYKSIGSFKRQSRLYTWIYRIATNEAITFMKKKRKRDIISMDEYVETVGERLQTDPFFDGDAAQLILQKALAQLPDKQRLVFNMKYFDDLPYKEMSEILETSVGALKASYHHAVKKIEQFVKDVEV